MVKLRFTRTGRKNLAAYRIVAIDSHSKRESKSLAIVGHYSPHTKAVSFDVELVKYWLSVGAQPSDSVARLLVKEGLLDKAALPTKKYKVAGNRKNQERAAKKAAPAPEAKAVKPAEVEKLVEAEQAAPEPAEEAAA